MKIIVKVKPRAKTEKVERVGQDTLDFGSTSEPIVYKVSVKEAPVNGKANDAVLRALATYFEVAPSCVRLVSGQTSKQKLFEILM